MSTLAHLNYLHVLVAAIAGFLLGWLWYSVLFGKAWMAEMKITEQAVNEAKGKMGLLFLKGFVCTFVSSVGLAMIVARWSLPNVVKGAELGAAVGLLIVGARFLNSGIWERRSCKLQSINVGHEVVLFALQGAILAALA
jgi:hypothetical protein